MRRVLWECLLVAAVAALGDAQTITLEGETNKAPTFDRQSERGDGPFGNDIEEYPLNESNASGQKNIGSSWSGEFYSYDLDITTAGYYQVDFYYATLKSRAQVIGPDCAWEDCQGLPAYRPYRVAIYARSGMCSKYADPLAFVAGAREPPASWNFLNCQNPGFKGKSYMTLLPKATFGNTAGWRFFQKLTAPRLRKLAVGKYCVQLCGGWDIGGFDRIVLTKRAAPVEEQKCGNGVCSPGENCRNCPDDCGTCEAFFKKRIIGNARKNFFYSWAFDEPVPATLQKTSPIKELSAPNTGHALWRPDWPSVDISYDEISPALDDNQKDEYQSYTIWVAQTGTYMAGVHYHNNDSANTAQRLVMRMGPGKCHLRAKPYCGAADTGGWTKEVLKPTFGKKIDTNLGLVDGMVQGYETIMGAPFTLGTTGWWCAQVCVLNGNYKTSRFVFENTSFNKANIVPFPAGGLKP